MDPGLLQRGTVVLCCSCRTPGGCRGPPWCPVPLSVTPQAHPTSVCPTPTIAAPLALLGGSFCPWGAFPARISAAGDGDSGELCACLPDP